MRYTVLPEKPIFTGKRTLSFVTKTNYSCFLEVESIVEVS